MLLTQRSNGGIIVLFISMKSNIKGRQKWKCFLLKKVKWKLSMMHLIYNIKSFHFDEMKVKRFINNFWAMPWKWSMWELASIISNKKKLLTLLTTRISPFNVCREFVLAKSSKKRFWCKAKYCWISYPKSKLSVMQKK